MDIFLPKDVHEEFARRMEDETGGRTTGLTTSKTA